MNNKYFGLLFIIFLGTSLKAQSLKYDSAIMGAGYANQIFYDMATGQKGSALVSNWDIAHTSDARDNCIRVNHKNGIEVFYYGKSNKDGWATFDTTGWKTWNRYYNDIHDHKKGALNHQSSPPWGIGWGTYNSGSHETIGDSLYLLAWFDGSKYTKFMKFQPIKQTVTANLVFRYANVDGTNEIQDTLFQSAANGQNYKYYSFAGKTRPVREPSNASWDINFSSYIESVPIGGGSFLIQSVMGVESNRGTLVAQIKGPTWAAVLNDSDNLIATYKSAAKDDLTAIGRSWKRFDSNLFKWFLTDTLSYMIKSVRGSDSVYWLIHFTGVTGSSSGKSVFAKMMLGKTNALEVPQLGKISVYPVPANNMIYVAVENNKINSGKAIIRDLSGKTVSTVKIGSSNTFNAIGIPVSGIASGTYVLCIESGAHKYNQKIVIQ